MIAARLSAHLIGFKGPRLAERARLERVAFYPSLQVGELYQELQRINDAKVALGVPRSERELRKWNWLSDLQRDAVAAVDAREVAHA